MTDMVTLESLPRLDAQRLSLRPLTPDDADDVYAVFTDPQSMRYWSSPPMTEPAQAAAYIAQIGRWFQTGGGMQWGIARYEDDRVIGTVTLCAFVHDQQRCEVGFILGSPWWRQGLAREAVTRVLRFAFDALAMERIEADVDPRNHASSTLLRRLGFVEEGLMRERWRIGGEVQDSQIFGLLRREFPADGAPAGSGR